MYGFYVHATLHTRTTQPHTYATLTFSGEKFADRTPIVTLPDVETPVCEGSLVSYDGALYFSHPQSTTARTALTCVTLRTFSIYWS